jgi:hypothetical protein
MLALATVVSTVLAFYAWFYLASRRIDQDNEKLGPTDSMM